MKKIFMVFVILNFVLCLPYSSHALVIKYKLTQLDDGTDNSDSDGTSTWRYNYKVINDTEGYMFSLGFTPGMGSIVSYEGLPETWYSNSMGTMFWCFDSLDEQGSVEPVQYDDDLHPGDTWNFSVTYSFFDDGTPGSQAFNANFHYQSSTLPFQANEYWSEYGQTTPEPVPEPASLLLLSSGLLGLAGFRKKWQK